MYEINELEGKVKTLEDEVEALRDTIKDLLGKRNKKLLKLVKKARACLDSENYVFLETVLDLLIEDFEEGNDKMVRFTWDGHEYKCSLPGEQSGLYKLIEPIHPAPLGAG